MKILRVKKVKAPSKNPKKCLIIRYATDKKIISRTFKIRGTLVFLCPKERERERESKSESESESKSNSKSKSGKGKGTGTGTGTGKGKEKEIEYKSAGDFISKSPGPE